MLKKEKAATALLDAVITSDAQAAMLHGITDRTLRRYRRLLSSDPELAVIYERKKVALTEAANLALLNSPPIVATVDRRKPRRERKRVVQSEYASKEFQLAVANSILEVARFCGLTEVQRVECKFRLRARRRVDLLISHLDGTFTLCDVRAIAWRKKTEQDPIYPAIGQLLFYHAIFTECFSVEPARTRLVIFTDHPWCTYTDKALAGIPVKAFDVYRVVKPALTQVIAAVS